MVGCSELTPDPGSTGRNTGLSIFKNVQTQLDRDRNGEEQTSRRNAQTPQTSETVSGMADCPPRPHAWLYHLLAAADSLGVHGIKLSDHWLSAKTTAYRFSFQRQRNKRLERGWGRQTDMVRERERMTS